LINGALDQSGEDDAGTCEGSGNRRLDSKKFHDLNFSPDIIRVIRFRKIWWAWNSRERREIHIKLYSENLRVRGRLEDTSKCGRTDGSNLQLSVTLVLAVP
jgi:hypothetical protein